MKPLERTVVGFLDAFVRDVHEQKKQNTNIFFPFNAPSVCESQHFCLASRYFKVFYSTSARYKPLSRISLMALLHLNAIKNIPKNGCLLRCWQTFSFRAILFSYREKMRPTKGSYLFCTDCNLSRVSVILSSSSF